MNRAPSYYSYYYCSSWTTCLKNLIIILLLFELVGKISSQTSKIRCGSSLHNGGDARVTTPWTAIIFLRNKFSAGQYHDWMSGIVVGPSTIITRGRNFWEAGRPGQNLRQGDLRMFGFKPSNYLVGVGISNRKEFQPDEFTQFLEIEYIRPHPKSYIEHSEFDFAIIQLKETIKFSAKVRPICVEASNASSYTLDFDSPFLVAPKKLSGFRHFPDYSFHTVPHKLRLEDICNTQCQGVAPLSTEEQLAVGGPPCQRQLEKDRIENTFLVGASLASWHKGRWYLAGMVTKSYGCSSSTKFSHFISLVTLKDNLPWINANIRNGGKSYTCLNGDSINTRLICDGKVDCKSDGGSDEETSFCEAWSCTSHSLSYEACNVPNSNVAKIRNGPNSIHTVTLNSAASGSAETGFVPAKPTLATTTTTRQPVRVPVPVPVTKRPTTGGGRPPLPSRTTQPPTSSSGKTCTSIPFTSKEREGIKFQCTGPNEGAASSACMVNAKPGTKILLTCLPHYKSGSSVSFTEMTCGSDGVWKGKGKYFNCVVECGIPKAAVSGHIVNGTSAERANWPWNSALFWKNSKGEFVYICGATLITTNAVITAAHCFNSVLASDQTQISTSFKIVLAPSSSKLELNYNDPHTQVVGIAAVHVNELYNSVTFEADIAIVKLSQNAEISDFIYPACFPFPGRENEQIERFQISPGNTGIVVGFGTDGIVAVSPTLRKIKLPVVSTRDCFKVLDIFPSATQICAGYTTGKGVCNGDSGAGLYFQEEGARKLYFVQGIVSHGQRTVEGQMCDHYRYSIFTRVGGFKEWVERIVNLLSD